MGAQAVRQPHYPQGEDIPETADTGMVGQQGLLPTPNDPKLWLVTCKAGHEREAVVQLLQKSYTMAERGTPLSIMSAVALDHLPVGRVECRKGRGTGWVWHGLRMVAVRYGGWVMGVAAVPLTACRLVSGERQSSGNRECLAGVRTLPLGRVTALREAIVTGLRETLLPAREERMGQVERSSSRWVEGCAGWDVVRDGVWGSAATWMLTEGEGWTKGAAGVLDDPCVGLLGG